MKDGESAIDAIQFDTDGWTAAASTAEVREWRDGLGNTLRLSAHPSPPDYLDGSPDLQSVTAFCRSQADARGRAIISVEIIDIAGLQGLAVINKGEGGSSGYDGTITIPLDDVCFRIEMNATEHGVSGQREAVVTAHLVESGELQPSMLKEAASHGGRIPGWFYDPYDPNYSGRVLHSIFDDARIDPLFVTHPLTRIRQTLNRVRRTATLEQSRSATSRFVVEGSTSREYVRSPVPYHIWLSLHLKSAPPHEVVKIFPELLQLLKAKVPEPKAFARQALSLGFICERQRQWVSAEEAFRAAHASFGEAVGQHHLMTAQAISSVARMLICQSKPDEAESLFRQALPILEGAGDDVSTAVALNGLGIVHNLRQRYSDAIPLFERAVALFEKARGPDFPEVATVLRHLALSWKRIGNMERMVEAWQRAEQIDLALTTPPAKQP